MSKKITFHIVKRVCEMSYLWPQNNKVSILTSNANYVLDKICYFLVSEPFSLNIMPDDTDICFGATLLQQIGWEITNFQFG